MPQAQHQLARATQGPHRLEPVLAKDLRAVIADALVRLAVTRQTRHRLDQAVSTHTDQLACTREGDLVPMLFEGFDPGVRVRIVAIDQRSVDIEEDRGE